MPANPLEAVLEFVRLMNARDPAGMAELLSPDSVLVDSLGARLAGR